MFAKRVVYQADMSAVVRNKSGCAVKPEQTACSKQQIQSESPRKVHRSDQTALAQFDELPDSAFVRQPVVLGLFACSQATLWRWVKNSLVPAPKRIGNRVSAWQVGELRQALRKIAASGHVGITAIVNMDNSSKMAGSQ